MLAMIFFIAPLSGAPVFAYSGAQPSDPIQPYEAYLSNLKIMNGYPDGSFHADKQVTRAEMSVLLVRAAGLPLAKPSGTRFKDVQASHWANSSIIAVANAGLIRGYPDRTFRPEQKVSRAEAAVMIGALTKEPLPLLVSTAKDVPPGFWAGRNIHFAVSLGLIPVDKQNCFVPAQPITRGELAVAAAKMMLIAPEYRNAQLKPILTNVKGLVKVQPPEELSRAVSGEMAITAGTTVSTGAGGEAELRIADGTSLLVKENTTLQILEMRGQAAIKQDGSPTAIVDWLRIDLKKGRVYGALATSYYLRASEVSGKPGQAVPAAPTGQKNAAPVGPEKKKTEKIVNRGSSMLAAATSEAETAQTPWFKQASAKRVRMQVDMPWGIAGIRGCIWSNEVTDDTQSTSVAEGAAGDVTVTSGGQTIGLNSGEYSFSKQGMPPSQPTPMPATEKQAWQAEQAWVQQTASAIEMNAPVPAWSSSPTQARAAVTPVSSIQTTPGTAKNSNNPSSGLATKLVQTVQQSIGIAAQGTAASAKEGAIVVGGGGGGGGAAAGATPGATQIANAPLGTSVSLGTATSITFANGVTLNLAGLNLPAGASVCMNLVANPVLPIDAVQAGPVVDIQFTGVTINSPVSLSLPITGPNPANVGIFYQNGANWDYQSTQVNGTTATAVVNHFSIYGVLESAQFPTQPQAVPSGAEPVTVGRRVYFEAIAGAQIYYTTNGSSPTNLNWNLYNANLGIPVPANGMTLKAVAMKSGVRCSAVSTFTFTIAQPQEQQPGPSNEASLTDLSLCVTGVDQLTGAQAFSPNDVAYEIAVANNVTSLTLDSVKANVNEDVKYYAGSLMTVPIEGTITLAEGVNTLLVKVTSQDQSTTKVYTVVITRQAALSSEASLADLNLCAPTGQDQLTTFSPTTLSYTIAVKSGVTSLTLDCVKANNNADVKYYDIEANPTVPITGTVALDYGTNTLLVRVTSQDGSVTKEYSVTITRQEPPQFTQEPEFVKCHRQDNSFNDFSFRVKVNKAGTIHCVAVPDGSPAPTTDQIKNGLDANSQPAVWTDHIASAANTATEISAANVLSLFPEITCDIYVVAEDINENFSDIVSYDADTGGRRGGH